MAAVYILIESCMQPNGAWAKSQATFADGDEAVAALATWGWRGPDSGLFWSAAVCVVCREGRERVKVAQRNLDVQRR